MKKYMFFIKNHYIHQGLALTIQGDDTLIFGLCSVQKFNGSKWEEVSNPETERGLYKIEEYNLYETLEEVSTALQESITYTYCTSITDPKLLNNNNF